MDAMHIGHVDVGGQGTTHVETGGGQMSAQIEYLGFTSRPRTREYAVRVRLAGDSRDFRLAIPNEAFLSGLERYQDAPEICFLIVQREVLASEGALPGAELSVTDADLAEYRTAHTPRKRRSRPA